MKSTITEVVVTNMDKVKVMKVIASGNVTSEDDALMVRSAERLSLQEKDQTAACSREEA